MGSFTGTSRVVFKIVVRLSVCGMTSFVLSINCVKSA